MATNSYRHIQVDGKQRLAHRVIAERALGKPLPRRAVVHHVDGDRANNANSNLVICQDSEYHTLLHNRQRALEATGNANSVRCGDCGNWVVPGSDHASICPAVVGKNGGKARGFAKYPLLLGRAKYDNRTRRTIPRKAREGEGCISAYGNRFISRELTPE